MNIPAVVARSRSALVRLVWPAEARCVRFAGRPLPPRQLRSCGARFWDDPYFVQSGVAEARRLKDVLGLAPASRVLEIGCGAGRTAIGLLHTATPLGGFDGVDINRRAIAWCRKFISRENPRYRFWAVDARHERWNPDGVPMADGFSLPFDAGVFDIVYLHSVLSNMIEEDVRIYARELRRLVAPGGRLFLTAFVEEDVAPVTVNPENYVMPCRGPLHIVRYAKRHLLSILASAGFELERFDYARELDGQSGVYLRPAA